MKATVSSRHGVNPDHNLWNNHGTWWCHFTVHHPNYTKERVSVSLGTKDLAEARRQRDFIMRGTNAIVARIPQRLEKHMPAIRRSRSSAEAQEPFLQTRTGRLTALAK